MKIERFSKKQLQILNWWHPNATSSHCDGIICDGAVRSGKTLCLSLSFLLWSHFNFSEQDFALCAKTIGSLRRNLITPLLSLAKNYGFT